MFNLIPSNKRIFGVDNIIESFFNDAMFPPLSTNFSIDIQNNENEYILEADIPGVSKEQIHVDYNNNYLTISIKSKEEYNEESKNYIRIERRLGKFSRSFYVENVDAPKIKSQYTNGVLKVILPKSKDLKI